jgi:hypothetical protein
MTGGSATDERTPPRRVMLPIPNSLVLIEGSDSSELPTALDGLITATPTVIAIGTLAEADGATSLGMSSAGDADLAGLERRWSGQLRTSGRLVLADVHGAELLRVECPALASVEIWTSDPDEPDVIWIVV